MLKMYLAGFGNSGPQHWQSLWHARRKDGPWVEHASWELAPREAWVEDTRRALDRVQEPVVFVAHSLGCLLAAEYLTQHGPAGVAGAFLVSVPDARGLAFPRDATGFRPALELDMPVPSSIVASSNDPYGSPEHARSVAARWKSALIEVGPAGHINSESNLGEWPAGTRYLEQFIQSLR